MTENKLTAQFEFTGSGCLKAILLNAWSEKEQATLECAWIVFSNPNISAGFKNF